LIPLFNALGTAALSIAALIGAGLLYRRQRAQNARFTEAIDNMTQGLVMFDAQGRIVVVNRRYIDMYGLSPQIVRPGLTLKQLIEHRRDTGLFTGDVESYCQNILDVMRAGKNNAIYVTASDGRIVLAKNEPLPGGGWVSTHEDVTEQRRAEEERAAIDDQEQRRATVDASIASFRPRAETLLSSVSASAMQATAAALFGSSDQTTQRTESAVEAFNEASSNVETAAAAAGEL
jgi:methyl-accepting chemotaxis protein